MQGESAVNLPTAGLEALEEGCIQISLPEPSLLLVLTGGGHSERLRVLTLELIHLGSNPGSATFQLSDASPVAFPRICSHILRWRMI